MTDSATLYMATITLRLGEIGMEKKEEEEYSIWIQRGKERNSEKKKISFVWFVKKRTRKNI